MEWLEDMKKRRAEKTLARHKKNISNELTNSEKRYGAAEALREIGTPEAIYGLMHRYDFTFTQQTVVDAEEKEYVSRLVLSYGDDAIEPVKRYLRECLNPSWPVKILKELVPEEDVIEALLDLVESRDTSFKRFEEGKILEILNYLDEHRDPRITDKALAFLDHMSDDMRLAAIKAIENQGEERARERLIDLLCDADEVQRIKVAVAEALANLGWIARGRTKEVKESLPDGFYLIADGRIRRRGSG